MSHEHARIQIASSYVEESMIAFLMNFTPAQSLSVADVKCIALFARNFAYEEMYTKIKDQYK